MNVQIPLLWLSPGSFLFFLGISFNICSTVEGIKIPRNALNSDKLSILVLKIKGVWPLPSSSR